MPILKCKMCGGNLNITDNDTVCTCEYCGTTQTIPLIDSDKKARLFNRANDYRLNNDFSRAYNAYEAIVSENPNEAEAYWGMILSEYGVEYVDDPKTGKKIPTCHRTSLKSIKTNNNYLKAIEYADIEGKMIYEDEVDQLDKLQKDILSVSSKEKPYDVFICYKESDDNGERTLDSVIAQELYDELSNRGMNVFFARISLEDKFGQNYEPYIYNALRSAKAMLLVTTSSEHCNATWVKNEWSRYLDFIKNDISRSLIPVIKDISPYELPDELQKLQVLDLNKIGAKQDLIRGIVKITGKDTAKQTVVSNSANTDSLLKRGFIFAEDGDFKSADEYFDRVLDNDPENGEAYLGKLLVEKHLPNIESLVEYYKQLYSDDCFEEKSAFDSVKDHISELISKYAIKNYYDEENIVAKYNYLNKTYSSSLQNRKEQKNKIEQELNNRMISRVLSYAPSLFTDRLEEIKGVYDKRIEEAERTDKKKIEELREYYQKFISETDETIKNESEIAAEKKENDYKNCVSEISDIQTLRQAESLLNSFSKLDGYKDSKDYIKLCNEKIDALTQTEKKQKEIADRKKKRMIIIAVALTLFAVTAVAIYITVIAPLMNYNKAIATFDNKDYESAYTLFDKLGDYKNSLSYKEKSYTEYLKKSFENCSVGDVVKFGTYEQDNNASNGNEQIEWIVISKEGNKYLLISCYGLDIQQYNSTGKKATWATCSIRNWLNNSFYNDAFSDIDKMFISETTVTADKNPKYNTDQGNDTQDKVFLLSITEANTYFSLDIDRQCKATEYANSNGAYINESDGNCKWWLRTNGSDLTCAGYVGGEGSIGHYGRDVGGNDFAVRPALWIDLQ